MTLVAIAKVISFYNSNGYLPPPFFDQSLDTFMDWYNTVYWGYRPGAYDEWFAVYPPFAFLFMGLFSLKACYSESAAIARDCDPLGVLVITAFTIVNAILLYLNYRKADTKSAWPRTIALGVGMPALFAWERGNVIVPCFTFFILAHGLTPRAAWMRWVGFGLAVNLKTYLLVTAIGGLLRRQWRWLEGCAIVSVLLYVASFALLGKGSPFELISNTLVFSGVPEHLSIDYLEYTTTYNSMLDMVKSQLPLMHFIGSRPMELAERLIPWAIGLGTLGVFTCFAGAALRPGRIPSYRLTGLCVALLLTLSRSVGAYAELFLIFLVFFERWGSVGQAVALIAAYSLCVPWDYMLVRIVHAVTDSYLSGRTVGYDFGVTLGAIVRPGLILAIEYGLVMASLADLRGTRRPGPKSIGAPSGQIAPGFGVAAGAPGFPASDGANAGRLLLSNRNFHARAFGKRAIKTSHLEIGKFVVRMVGKVGIAK